MTEQNKQLKTIKAIRKSIRHQPKRTSLTKTEHSRFQETFSNPMNTLAVEIYLYSRSGVPLQYVIQKYYHPVLSVFQQYIQSHKTTATNIIHDCLYCYGECGMMIQKYL